MNNSNLFSVLNGLPKCFSKQTQISQFTFDFILDSLKRSLGNSESVKCVCIDPLKSTMRLEKCWIKILDELIHSSSEYSTDSFVRFLQKSIISHHNHHVCSTKTAICFFTLLWRRIKCTVDDNSLDAKLLSKYLNIVLEKTINLCEQNHLEYLPLAKISQNHNQNIKILSRHMKNLEIKSDLNLNENLEFYTQLVNGISRDQKTFSSLMLDLLKEYEQSNLTFNIESLFVTTASISTNLVHQDFQYDIFDGFLLSLDDFNKETCNKISFNNPTDKTLNCLFINGSLTQDHLHTGFNKNLNFTKYNTSKDYLIESFNEWEENVKQVLLKNKIKILFIREKIDKNLKEFCRINSLLIFAHFSSSSEKKLKHFFKCPSIVYIEDISNDDVFKLKLSKIEKDFIVLNFPNDDNLEKCFSILLKSRIQSTVLMHVEYLNHCLKRLSNILASRQYLNGTNAQIEKSLSDSIKNFCYSDRFVEESDIYFELAKELVANAFADFYLIVCANNSGDQKIKYFDDFQSKSEAWRLSFYICCIFLNSDYSIVN